METLLNALYRFARNLATDCEVENCRKAAQRLAKAVKRLEGRTNMGTFTRVWVFFNEEGFKLEKRTEILDALKEVTGGQPHFMTKYGGFYWEDLNFDKPVDTSELLRVYLKYKPYFKAFSAKIFFVDKGQENIELDKEKGTEEISLWLR